MGFGKKSLARLVFVLRRFSPHLEDSMKKWIGLLALLMLALVCATALGETNTQVKH